MRPHDAINISYHNRLNLERAKFAVFAASEVISVRFDLNQGRKKQWMHDFILVYALNGCAHPRFTG